MNTLLCVLGVILAVASVRCEMPSEEIKQAFKECHTELGMPDEKPQGPPNMDDPKVKCFHACIMKKAGKMVDGKVDADKETEFIQKHMPNADDSLIQKITECVKTANEQSDECEVAGAMHKCIMENVGPPPPHRRQH